MRVKTAPRQRMMQNNNDIDELSEWNNQLFSKDEERETSEDGVDSLNGNKSDNLVDIEEEKAETLKYCQEVVDMSMKYKPTASTTATIDTHASTTCSLTGAALPSKTTPTIHEGRSSEAMNLCKKDQCSNERLKDTFLYKIMTDPTFLEKIQKHKQPKRHACQFCKQEFPNGEELAEHMDVKTDESNQVICCACKKTFAQKRYLRYHQRCHSERTKFTCDICTKKYTRLDNLTRHNAFHVNPDKFSCTYCDKTFARKDLLNKHLKCHDNKYRIFCEMCQKYFKGPVMMENHKKMFHEN